MSEDIQISIIIPNLHSEIINLTIESVYAQKTTLQYEIIVVGMDKFGLVKQYPRVKFIQTTTPVGAAEARNIGIKQSRGKWLIFIDSDCIAHNGWLESFISDFKNGWKVIGGGVQSPPEPFWRLVYNLSMFHAYLSSTPSRVMSFLPTLNLAVHRDVIEKVGLMDENLVRGQDVDWTSRMTLAGYKLFFNPLATIDHLPGRNNLETLRDFNRKSGYYMIRVRYRYPEIFHMPWILRFPFSWRLFSPFIAIATTLKIALKSKEVRKHLRVLPYIYLLKLSWCYGAAESLEKPNDQ